MTETSVIPAATRFLDHRVPQGMETLGIRTVGAIAQSIDTACPEYHQGFGGHSAPGDPPFRETGQLYSHVSHSESSDDSDFITRIDSTRPPTKKGESPLVPLFLEFGTSGMAARPYMRPVMARGWQLVRLTMRKLFSGGAPYDSLN